MFYGKDNCLSLLYIVTCRLFYPWFWRRNNYYWAVWTCRHSCPSLSSDNLNIYLYTICIKSYDYWMSLIFWAFQALLCGTVLGGRYNSERFHIEQGLKQSYIKAHRTANASACCSCIWNSILKPSRAFFWNKITTKRMNEFKLVRAILFTISIFFIFYGHCLLNNNQNLVNLQIRYLGSYWNEWSQLQLWSKI